MQSRLQPILFPFILHFPDIESTKSNGATSECRAISPRTCQYLGLIGDTGPKVKLPAVWGWMYQDGCGEGSGQLRSTGDKSYPVWKNFNSLSVIFVKQKKTVKAHLKVLEIA